METVQIFLTVILPLFLVVGIGFLTQRLAPLDVSTLVRLNLYLFAPAYLLSRLSTLDISPNDLAMIGLTLALPMLGGAALLFLIFRPLRWNAATLSSVIVGSCFFNSGNFGVAVSELKFGADGGKIQSVVVMFTCLMTFFAGYGILALGQGFGLTALARFFQLPYLYVVLAAVAIQSCHMEIPAWLAQGVDVLAQGMVPTALITLGAQMAQQVRWPNWSLVLPVVILKLIALPLVTLGLVRALGLWPFPGQILVVATAAPTAVNTLLLTIDLQGDADLAADFVFWTTTASALTVAAWISILT